jgi:FKBP-type peptidyl-prolyl cis-trans isomerase
MSMKQISRLIITSVILMTTFAGCMHTKTSTVKLDNTVVPPPPAAMESMAKPNLTLQTNVDKMSYSYGVEVEKGLMKQEIDINPDAMSQGMKDAMAGGKLLMDADELRAYLSMFQANARAKVMAARLNVSQNNKKAGDAFLAENKTKEGVITLESGVQYKILKAGSGPKPTDSDTVACYYKGTLIDGTEFDSTFRGDNEEGDPSPIKVSSTIPGFREALKLMPVGSRWQIYIPSNLAYGTQGTGNLVGPNATLIFEVELVSIM